MDRQNQMDRVPGAKSRGRGCLVWLGGLAIFVVALVVIGLFWESASEAADQKAYPPAGQMVDVGGYRLHIHCTGTGSPTVVIDAGWGDWSLMWSRVQPGVADVTRVCTYDRAGMGYSEAGPLPRTAERFAQELHTLLSRAGVPGPYILVGHSLGGLPVRVYAHEYPAEVAGVVLIDSMSPEQATAAATGAAPQASSGSSGSPIPSLLARVGVMRLLGASSGPSQDLPSGAKEAYAAFGVTPRAVQAWADEGSGLPASMVEAGAVKSLGDLPLIVLTAGLNHQANWQAMQTRLLDLSSHSQQQIAEKSGHNIEIEQPQAAVEAILTMVGQLRHSTKQ